MSRFPLALALVPASLAVHLLLAACSGGDTPSAQAGSGGGGGGGASAAGSGGAACTCEPKAPTVHVVPCSADASTVMVAELDLPGKSIAELAAVQAVGKQTKPAQGKDGTQIGSVPFGLVKATPFLADGRVMVLCGPGPNMFQQEFESVTFYVP